MSDPTTRTADEIREWLINHLAEVLNVDADDVETDITFQRYGLSSIAAVGLTGDLEAWLKTDLDPTLAYDYPTIDALTEALADVSPR